MMRPELPVEAGEGKTVRVVAGSLYGKMSPLATLSPTIFADVTLAAGARLPARYGGRGARDPFVSREIDILGDRFAAGRLLVFRPGDRITVTPWPTPTRLAILGGGSHRGGEGTLEIRPLRPRAGRRRIHPAAGSVWSDGTRAPAVAVGWGESRSQEPSQYGVVVPARVTYCAGLRSADGNRARSCPSAKICRPERRPNSHSPLVACRGPNPHLEGL